MPKLINVDEWIKQMDQMIDRLLSVQCDKCLPEFMERMVNNKTIQKYEIKEDFVSYTIQGQEHKKELK